MWRITTLFSGPKVVGGGISQLYFNDAAGDIADAKLAVQNFWALADDVVHVSTTISIQAEVETVSLSGSITAVETVGDVVNLTGTDDSDPLPPANQTLVRWRTGTFQNGREVRGRLFIPCGGEAYSVAGQPGGGRLTTLQGAVSGLVNDVNSTLVVFSRTHLVAPPVSAGQVAPYFAVLRSRRD